MITTATFMIIINLVGILMNIKTLIRYKVLSTQSVATAIILIIIQITLICLFI